AHGQRGAYWRWGALVDLVRREQLDGSNAGRQLPGCVRASRRVSAAGAPDVDGLVLRQRPGDAGRGGRSGRLTISIADRLCREVGEGGDEGEKLSLDEGNSR